MNGQTAVGGAVFSGIQAAEWTGGTWRGGDPATAINGIFTDTRTAVPGAMYIAIKGANFDGHAFVGKAMEAGASSVMVNASAEVPPGIPALVVADTEAALAALAAGWRLKVDPVMVGITGSAGKTTVKELVAHLLGAAGKTARSLGNWNNSLGLPKSLLAMEGGTRFGVFEAGTNHPGEIAPLARLMQPDCAVITNVGPVHIEYFGTEESIADEKAELIRAVPADGFAVLNADSPHYAYLSRQPSCRVVSVSVEADSDFRAERCDAATGTFSVRDSDGTIHELCCGLPGMHQIANALEAVAVARQFGIGWNDIGVRLATTPHANMRWETTERNGVTWINDAYNANPLSMKKSLETFAAIKGKPGVKVAVLGDMFELGELEETLHREVGRAAGAAGLDFLVAVGERASKWIAGGASEAGMAKPRIITASDAAEAKAKLAGIIEPPAIVLVKASRGMALERILS